MDALTEGKKWMVIVAVALMFFLVSSPFMYNITQKIAAKLNLNLGKDGCPNYTGVIVHTIVFIIILRLLMFIKI